MGKKIQQNSKKKKLTLGIWGLIGSIILLLLLAKLIIGFVGGYMDKRQFEEISRGKDIIVSDLVNYQGDNVVSSEVKNECYNTNQGPYDDGRLWCQVSSIVQLRQDVDFKQLGDKFVEYAKSHGFETHASNNYGVPRYSFDTGHATSCGIGLVTTSNEHGSTGGRDVLYGVTPPAFAVGCSKPADAKHYPYID